MEDRVANSSSLDSSLLLKERYQSHFSHIVPGSHEKILWAASEIHWLPFCALMSPNTPTNQHLFYIQMDGLLCPQFHACFDKFNPKPLPIEAPSVQNYTSLSEKLRWKSLSSCPHSYPRASTLKIRLLSVEMHRHPPSPLPWYSSLFPPSEKPLLACSHHYRSLCLLLQ